MQNVSQGSGGLLFGFLLQTYQINTSFSILEKGILKKPGPYCSMDKDRDRWDDRISSSSQNNLINVGALPPPNHVGLSNHHSRQELAPHQHNTMSRSDLAHAANSLSRQDLTDHHSLSRQELPGHSSLSRQDISGRATLSGHSTLARGAANHAAMHPGYSTISRSGPTSMSRENLAGGHSSRPLGPGGHVSLSREELTGHGIIDRQDSRRDMSEVDRTLKSLNGYHEDILEVIIIQYQDIYIICTIISNNMKSSLVILLCLFSHHQLIDL